MPTGMPLESTLLLRRPQGKHILALHRTGPFIECYLDDILIGKVRGKQATLSPVNCEIEECIRLQHHTILLTVEEAVGITAAMLRPSAEDEDKRLREECPFAGRSDQDRWIAEQKAKA